ncbi:MAG: oligosaccharide flippase family protein [Omnitrophica bacterium]|nr:oligosaccharide flippase family protein [Candidatus Omnitrophota bacterium]
MSKLKKFFHLAGLYSIGSVLERALFFIFIPIYTFYLGIYEYGIIALMGITVSLLAQPLSAPVISGFIRYYHSPEYKDKKGSLLFSSFILLCLQACGLAVVFYCLRNLISKLVLADVNLVNIVSLYSVILFLRPVSNFLLNFVRQEEKARMFIVLSWLKFVVSSLVSLVGLIYLNLGILALIYGVLLGLACDIIYVFPMFWRNSIHQFSVSVLREPLKYGYPRILDNFSNLLIQSGDRYVLKIFFPLSVVGLYGFAYHYAGVISIFLLAPLRYAIQPIALEQEATPEKQKEFLRRAAIYFSFISMAFCLFIALYSQEIIGLVVRKKEFMAGSGLIALIAFSYLQHGLGNFFGWGLIMSKRSFYLSLNVLISAIVNISLNFFFIPLWGVLGAALATVISYFVWNGLKLYHSAKFYDLHFDLKRLSFITGLGIILYLFSLVIANGETIVLNVITKFLLIMSYFGIFFITKFFTNEEKKYLKKLWLSVTKHGLRRGI